MTLRELSRQRPLRIAVVGAGPAGFYATAALLETDDLPLSVDLFERLPAPYGLVRYGVAPDHGKIKGVTRVYERVALSERVHFFGNVEIGVDLPAADLLLFYDLVIYTVGALADRTLGIPGEDVGNCVPSTALVAWYNGHPHFADFSLDLDHESVAVVGVGNVAMDVARVLARSTDELARTDIADPALDRLRESRVREVHVLARRGPVHAKCSPAELKEIGEMTGVDVVVDPADLEPRPGDEEVLAGDRAAAKNLEHFKRYTAAPPQEGNRRIVFRFFVSPTEVLAEDGKTTGLLLEHNEMLTDDEGNVRLAGTGERERLDASLVVTAIGYRSVAIPGIPFDERRGVIPNDRGRVIDPEAETPVSRQYVAGWAKRGPQGLIGSNKVDAVETVNTLLDDLEALPASELESSEPQAIQGLLDRRGLAYVHFDHWQLLDRLEIDRGRAEGRPRVKFVRTEEMLEQLAQSGEAQSGEDPGSEVPEGESPAGGSG